MALGPFRFTAKNTKYRTWKFAVSKCIAWQGTQYDNYFKDFVYEDKGSSSRSSNFKPYTKTNVQILCPNPHNSDPDIQVRCSIPGSIYLISSIALLLITKNLHRSS